MLSKSAFDAMLSVSAIVVIALVWGGFALFRRGEDRRRATLMLVAAAVLLGNVLIWSWPS